MSCNIGLVNYTETQLISMFLFSTALFANDPDNGRANKNFDLMQKTFSKKNTKPQKFRYML
jgi:hypothetical protein